MAFFHNNPSGRILNRFSKDVGAMDELLPITLIEAMQVGYKTIIQELHKIALIKRYWIISIGKMLGIILRYCF